MATKQCRCGEPLHYRPRIRALVLFCLHCDRLCKIPPDLCGSCQLLNRKKSTS